jgi:hypothetical protein
MCEHCSDGSTVWAAIPRLAAYSKLSERKVQRLIRVLCGRGILSQLAPANTSKRRPTTYRLNEAALQEDPRMEPYRARQEQLPGIRRPPVPGEPISDRDLVSAGHQSGVPNDAHLVSSGHQSGVCETPDSKAFDPNAQENQNQNITPNGALKIWFSIKERLQKEFPEANWIRPIYLLRVYGDALGLVMPPNGEMVARAKSCSLLQELARNAGYSGALIGKYPEDYELERIRVAYPEHYKALPEALRRRFEKAN